MLLVIRPRTGNSVLTHIEALEEQVRSGGTPMIVWTGINGNSRFLNWNNPDCITCWNQAFGPGSSVPAPIEPVSRVIELLASDVLTAWALSITSLAEEGLPAPFSTQAVLSVFARRKPQSWFLELNFGQNARGPFQIPFWTNRIFPLLWEAEHDLRIQLCEPPEALDGILRSFGNSGDEYYRNDTRPAGPSQLNPATARKWFSTAVNQVTGMLGCLNVTYIQFFGPNRPEALKVLREAAVELWSQTMLGGFLRQLGVS